MKSIKMKRIDKDMTQSELAKKSELTQATLSSYETGKTSPKVSDLEKIAAALDCTVRDLV